MSEVKLMAIVRKVISTGAAAIALSTSGGRFRLVQATVKFDILPTTSERVTLTLNSVDGADYDAIVASADPSTGVDTGDVVFQGDPGDIYEADDELDLAYANTDTRTYGARIVTEPVS